MRLQTLAKVLVAAAGLALVTPAAIAQNGGARAELDAIKKEIASLQEAAANAPMLAQAVQELSSKVVVIEQELAKNASLGESMPAAIEKLDALEIELRELQSELEYLRTGIANIEQPAAVSGGGGGVEHTGSGFHFATADGNYDLTLGGYFQPRYTSIFPFGLESQDLSSFDARRARLSMKGKLQKMHYALSWEMNPSSGDFQLLDYFVDMKYRDSLKVRIGQAKVPYTRSFLASSQFHDALELSETQERQRYDREVGVWALGKLFDKKLRYHAGVSNGSGNGAPNDNIDLAVAARVEGVVMGEYIRPGFGDYEGREKPALTVGAAAVHDLQRLPDQIASFEGLNRDVDANGVLDNVRVISASMDAQFRYQGFEAFFEGTYRHERWGTILQHEDNAALADAVRASDDGVKNYLAFTTQASYFAMPKKLQVGARLSHGRLPLLGIGGRQFSSAPVSDRLLQTDLYANFWREGYRRVGLMYSLLNFNAIEGDDPADDKKHQIILEYQLIL